MHYRRFASTILALHDPSTGLLQILPGADTVAARLGTRIKLDSARRVATVRWSDGTPMSGASVELASRREVLTAGAEGQLFLFTPPPPRWNEAVLSCGNVRLKYTVREPVPRGLQVDLVAQSPISGREASCK
jgi:hypothetical protein